MIRISGYAEKVLSELSSNGFDAYIVGGCVRDSIMGKEPSDWDVTTNAKVHDIKRIFPKTFDTGIKHGTITVLSDDIPIEVTTYRIDGSYSDGRRPDSVKFSDNLQEDLVRRDFTINAMAYNDKCGLVDCFGGARDIERKIIRAVGEPEKRFAEDALRMLRAVRFSAQLGFTIENKTLEAIKTCRSLMRNVSRERVQVEINKILVSDYPGKLVILEETGLNEYIMPEISECFKTPQNTKYHIYDVGMHIVKAVEFAEKRLDVRLAALLHDVGKPKCRTTDKQGIDHFYGHGKISAKIAEQILRRLKYSNRVKTKVTNLVLYHDVQIELTENAVKRVLGKIDDDTFLDLIDLKRADTLAHNPEFTEGRLVYADNLKKIYDTVKAERQAFKISDLAIGGRELIEIGVPVGKQIGNILNTLLTAVIEDKTLNRKDVLLDIAKSEMKDEKKRDKE